MSQTLSTSPPVFITVADVLSSTAGVPPERLRMQPNPGTATEADLLRVNEGRSNTAICELVDGILVEKAMSAFESYLALLIGGLINEYLRSNSIGIALGADGMLRLAPGLVRVPDVCFISFDQLPDRKIPRDPIWNLYPELAVEVLSPSNTPREMENKLKHYFESGSKLVWYLDPNIPQMHVYQSEAEFKVIGIDGTVDGGDLLPGFTLSMAELFKLARSDEQ